jgi:hypothetical protein
VDDALQVEKKNLLALKKSLELILKPIQEHTFVSHVAMETNT